MKPLMHHPSAGKLYFTPQLEFSHGLGQKQTEESKLLLSIRINGDLFRRVY
jgi:hypothetical protein